MTRAISGFGITVLSLIMLAGCGGEEESPGTLSAQISCSAQDSLLATVYLTGGESAAASEWCACGSEACQVEFGGLGYGDYVLGVSVPDSLYLRTQGAEGLTRTLGYYAQGGLDEVADTVTLSAEQPISMLILDVEDAGPTEGPDADTLADTLGGAADM